VTAALCINQIAKHLQGCGGLSGADLRSTKGCLGLDLISDRQASAATAQQRASHRKQKRHEKAYP
jgi:hypothetical protein